MKTPTRKTRPTKAARFTGILEDIAREAGKETAIALARHYGGTTLFIPELPRKTNRLASIIGIDATRILCKKFKGEILYIPMNKAADLVERNAKIIKESRLYPIDVIAKKHGLSRRRVQNIISENRKNQTNVTNPKEKG